MHQKNIEKNIEIVHQKNIEKNIEIVRPSSQEIVYWTCVAVLALGQRFDSHIWRSFCCNPLNKAFTLYHLMVGPCGQ